MAQFSQSDIEQIEKHGLTQGAINQQLDDFVAGFPFADIVAPATVNNGVQEISDSVFSDFYDAHADEYKIVKFVPASGAATRMFKDLFEYLSTDVMNKTTQMVLDNLNKFAFYSELQTFLPANPSNRDVIECIITNRGLDYGHLPKGLLKFHSYDDYAATAVAEHLSEGAQYAASNGVVNIHFTVSPEHISGFKELLQEIVPIYERRCGVRYNIDLSVQKSATDTIAVNLDNTPFRNDDGTLLFRPSGHGALIENLNDIDADIVFIKNIDNVCPDAARDDTVFAKKSLAGMAIKIQRQIFEYLRALDDGNANMLDVKEFINKYLGIRAGDGVNVRDVLNRPLRVCGMVRNTGAAGGGPFWTRDMSGNVSLQIVESSQIAPDRQDILAKGEYFNPVDVVCMVRDYRGQKFDLPDFVDPQTGFISEKSKDGRPLRAMERPGLWNGAMAKWNTVFVAVPATTFTPAKVITDLLTQAHQQSE